MNNALTTALLLGLLLLASCATIMNGSTTDVEITSTPPGATFTSNRPGVQGVTPATLTIDNDKKAIHYEFTLEGYETVQHTDKGRISNWIIGNVVFGGIVGFLIDVVVPTSHIHHDVKVGMVPVGGVPEPAEDIQIASKPESNWSRKPDDN
jgi:hypothetical protein